MHAPSTDLLESFQYFADQRKRPPTQSTLSGLTGEAALPQFDFDRRRFVLVHATEDSLTDVAAAFKANRPPSFSDPHLFEINIAVEGLPASGHIEVIDRGVRAMSLHDAIAELLNLPKGWPDTQHSILRQALSSVPASAGKPRIAPLYVVPDGGEASLGLSWLSKTLTWAGAMHKPLYLRAEAGKGKTTLLAQWVQAQLDSGSGPLPLFVPLRDLQRGTGISWEAIAGSIGVIGGAAADLAAAVHAGLVALVLDGLDEVSGRYDRKVVQQVLNLALTHLASPRSIVALSGRTTEGTLLAPGDAVQVGLELPETESDAFRSYAASVIDGVVPDWPATARRLPEPPLALESMVARPFSSADRDALLAWVLASFDEVGKERSLFFVQSLACIGRTHQLSGNKPLVIRSPSSVQLSECSVYHACLLAASLACVREQGKVDDIARSHFSPDKQLTLLTWLALSSSAAPALNAVLPTPAERAQQVFGIDPVNETEQFTAVIRQAYKHALLFAARDTSGPVGDWRPAFLSEWVRCALLVRAWLGRLALATGEERRNLFAIVCRAERSRTAFQHIFADLANSSDESRAEDLAVELVRHATEGSPEACSNYWALIAGLSEEARALVTSAPSKLTPGADLSEMLLEGVTIGSAISGELGIFSGADFVGCTFTGISFESCDFSRATFRNCSFSKVTFGECDGPFAFDGCHFSDCTLANGRSPSLPTYSFHDCTFLNSTIVQASPAIPTALGPIANFVDCRASSPSELVLGEWSGLPGSTIPGLSPTQGPPAGDLAEITLVRLLRPFFPSHAGTTGESQARGYIRSSAIGRGVFPDGAPLTGALTQILLSEGFTTGGRSGHIYAPWSSVAGVTNRSLRSELAAFMRSRERGPTVQRLLVRIRREADWRT